MTIPPNPEFPVYTRLEQSVDGLIHLVGVSAATVATTWLTAMVARSGTATRLLAVALYGFGLLAMLSASAAYNLASPGRLKAVLRRLDHAMIFVMIAGSYTPFALCALKPAQGVPLFVAAWMVAAVGSGLRMFFGNRYEPAFIVLYLAQGWMILPLLPSVAASLPFPSLVCLVAGGVVYCLGVVVFTRVQWQLQNAVWHAMVLVAAALQWAAIAQVLEA